MQRLRKLFDNLLRAFNNLVANLFHRRQLSDAVLQQAAVDRAEEELKILHTDFTAAIKCFHENYKSHDNLPLYLLIGQTSFGKTTLLAKSGIDLRDIYGNQICNEFSTKYCVWLFSLQAIFLDTAGIYSQSSKENLHANLVWISFLNLLRDSFLHNHLGGVIVVIDIPTLAGSEGELRRTLGDIKERLYEMARYVVNLPVFIVFTKVDLIDGFVDCFDSWSLEERKQVFGITFAKDGKYANPQTSFPIEFNLLLQSLRTRLASQFHHEIDVVKRGKMQSFLLQFAHLRSAIAEVINEIPYGGGHIDLHGLYFVSSVQSGESNDYFMRQLQSALHLPVASDCVATLTRSAEDKKSSKTYFIEDLFKQELLANKVDNKVKTDEFSLPQFIFTLAMSLLLVVISFWWYKIYVASIDILSNATAILKNKEQPDHVLRLEQSIKYLKREEVVNKVYLGLNHVKRYTSSLQEFYYQKVAPDFTLQLKKTLEEEISATGPTNYKYLYDTLKTYLMLSNPKKIDNNFVQSWFENYWQKTFAISNAQVKDVDQARSLRLAAQLKMILRHGVKILPSDQIITTTREILNSYSAPKEDLIYIKLENMYSKKSPLIFKFGEKEVRISRLYTVDNFRKIYQKHIPKAVDNFDTKDSDWVLASASKITIAQNEVDKLIAGLRALYIKNYVDAWCNALQQIKLTKFSNINQMDDFLVAVKTNNYPLLPFIKELKNNLMISDAPVEFVKMVDTKLIDWRNVDLSAIYLAIENLSHKLSQITANADAKKAMFTAATARFSATDNSVDAINNLHKIALRYPQVVREWLQDIADDSWQLILSGAQSYISIMWSATVVPEYKKLINNTYPFFKNAQNSISLADLARFFATNGVMDGFFNNYLRVFVDTDQVYWVLKNVDGKRLGISDDQLGVFIRAALIRRMFYPNGGRIPEVKFSLMPQSLTPNTKQFNLNFGGQSVSHVKGQKEIDNLMWPGSNPALLNIEFIDNSGRTVKSTMSQDVWAWFRLLDIANVKATNKTQRFSFIIDLNGNAIKYDMYAEQPVNPFIPDIISNFRCPEKL